MKKMILVAGVVVFIAASCNNSAVVQAPVNVPPPPASNTPTPPPTPTPVSVTNAPKITTLTPSSGPVGTVVTIKGQGFTATGNQILLGDAPSSSHHLDKTPANVIVTADSADGTTLSFTFPSQGISGIICDVDNHCVGVAAMLLQPGSQKISVTNKNGLSNAAIFTITK